MLLVTVFWSQLFAMIQLSLAFGGAPWLPVKNMGGIGAHCAEDYETLKMFVEAPSTYKDEQKTC
jgi:hypothetical protein